MTASALPPSLLQLIHSLPSDLVAWYREAREETRMTLDPSPNTAAIAEHVSFDFSRAQRAVSNQTVAAQTSLKVDTNLETTPE
jgi:hypothetical protein